MLLPPQNLFIPPGPSPLFSLEVTTVLVCMVTIPWPFFMQLYCFCMYLYPIKKPQKYAYI